MATQHVVPIYWNGLLVEFRFTKNYITFKCLHVNYYLELSRVILLCPLIIKVLNFKQSFASTLIVMSI